MILHPTQHFSAGAGLIGVSSLGLERLWGSHWRNQRVDVRVASKRGDLTSPAPGPFGNFRTVFFVHALYPLPERKVPPLSLLLSARQVIRRAAVQAVHLTRNTCLAFTGSTPLSLKAPLDPGSLKTAHEVPGVTPRNTFTSVWTVFQGSSTHSSRSEDSLL